MLEAPRRRRIRRAEYDRLIEAGFFQGEKLELLRGELVHMSPVGSRHSWVVTAMHRALQGVIADRALVRTQQPIVAADESEPEPDVSVVTTNDPRAHPLHASLIVEVSESSLRSDLAYKAALYAESDVDEYWVIDLVDDLVHVHRDRAEGRWRSVTVHRLGETLSTVRFPDLAIAVASIIPAR